MENSMRILNLNFHFNDFYKSLEAQGPKLLFLDYDGTLSPFHVEPKMATPYPGIIDLLNSILENESVRLVIITGRAVRDIQPLLQLEQAVEIWGSHGRERLLPNGSHEQMHVSVQQQTGLDQGVTSVSKLEPLIVAEPKPGAVAFHWRSLKIEHVLQFETELVNELNKIAAHHKLSVQTFNGGIELLIPGTDKGKAVHAVMKELLPDTSVAYLGDDLTDEDAFRELKDKGLSVLVSPSLRKTRADLWIQPPEDLFWFLKKWVG